MKSMPFPQAVQKLIQIKEAAAMLGVSIVTIRCRVRDGSLPHVRIKGRLYFRANELHAYVEAHRSNLAF